MLNPNGQLSVNTTCPVAPAAGVSLTPVALNPCDEDTGAFATRTRIGALPGSATMSASWLNGRASATRVTFAEGTKAAVQSIATMATSPTPV